MVLSNREKKMLKEIREWENTININEPNDFQFLFDKYIENTFSTLPEKTQQQFFLLMDNWLFHLHAIIQSSEFQLNAKERILSSGRIFRSDIDTIYDLRKLHMDQLHYIANQQISRHRLYSFIQGGISGTGEVMFLGADLPAIAVINLRVVQLIALTYGYELNTPYEMMTSLKVFHASILPSHIRKQAWKELMNDLENEEDNYFYDGEEDLTNISTLEQPFIQLLKVLAILFFKKKKVQGLPLISMAIGAGANYQLTRKITDFSHKYYQIRYLKKRGIEHEYDRS